MREEALRQLMAKLGMGAIDRRRDSKGVIWLNHSCPFAPWLHQRGTDRRASFGIVVNDAGLSIYKCQACKQKGSTGRLVKLLQQYRKVDYSALLAEAEEGEKGVRRFADFDTDPVGAEIDPLGEPLLEEMWDGLFDPIEDHKEAARFMVKRGVSRATCHKLGLAFDPDKRRIVFPVKSREGALYGFSGRTVIPNHEPKVLDYGGLPKRHLILGAHRWTRGRKKLLVEGLIAFARMHEIGAEEIVDIGALLGSEMTDEKAEIVRQEGDCTVLLLDPDEAGDHGTFGVFDPVEERFKIENAAIGKLWGHVPLIVPEFPEMPDDVELDVDNLTFEHVEEMVAQRLWRPNKDQTEQLRRAGRWMEMMDR